MRRCIAILAAPLLLGACVHLFPETPPAPTIYPLAVGEVEHYAGKPSDAVIAVAQPEAPRSFAGSDLIWMENGSLAAVHGIAWSNRVPVSLQTMLVETIERQAMTKGAVRVGDGARADFEIRWDIIHFEIVDGNEARFGARVRLINSRNRTLQASTLLQTAAPLASRSGRLTAEALQEAARKGTGEIAAWAAQQVETLIAADAVQPKRAQPSAASISK